MEKKEEKFWSAYAENFDQLNQYVIGKEDMKIFLDRVGRLKDLGNTLEIACGNGTYTKVLAQNAKHIVATDFSKQMVAVSKEILKPFDHIEVKEADAFDLKMEENSFDTIFLANFLHVVGNCNALLEEMHKFLKVGGRIICLDATTYRMSFFHKLGMMYRFIKTYGKPDQKAEKSSLHPRYVEDLFLHNHFEKESIEVIGKKSKALLAIGRKIERGSTMRMETVK